MRRAALEIRSADNSGLPRALIQLPRGSLQWSARPSPSVVLANGAHSMCKDRYVSPFGKRLGTRRGGTGDIPLRYRHSSIRAGSDFGGYGPLVCSSTVCSIHAATGTVRRLAQFGIGGPLPLRLRLCGGRGEGGSCRDVGGCWGPFGRWDRSPGSARRGIRLPFGFDRGAGLPDWFSGRWSSAKLAPPYCQCLLTLRR
jgi:hypothetical protein